MTRSFSDDLVAKTRAWLGKDGHDFFTRMVREHGRVDAVYPVYYAPDRAFPHCVHLREGMQVRNWLRDQKECENWTAHDLDDTWVSLIERAIA